MATQTGKLEGPAGRSGLARSLSPEHVRWSARTSERRPRRATGSCWLGPASAGPRSSGPWGEGTGDEWDSRGPCVSVCPCDRPPGPSEFGVLLAFGSRISSGSFPWRLWPGALWKGLLGNGEQSPVYGADTPARTSGTPMSSPQIISGIDRAIF